MDQEMEDIRKDLWTTEVQSSAYEGAGEKYQAAIMDQYKIYVEMADRVSARRGAANTFFLTLNTGIGMAAVAFAKDHSSLPSQLVLLALIVASTQCVGWWWLVRSYRLLNSAKYKVVGLLEERLPASPYWRAEWTSLGKGEDWRKYLPLTHLEQWVPVVFAAVYLIGGALFFYHR